ncbi:MAG: tRNA lysidine(34) synthetase TilS [bacterium]
MEADFIKIFSDSLALFDFEGKTLRVALSGGCDSVALMELLHRTFDTNRLAAVHVDHGIRAESCADADFVRDFCKEHGIPLDIRFVETVEYAEKQGLGIEEAARELRYGIFREFTSAGEIVATAHTADDCVETLLFNLVRGAGPRGLGGIPRERDGIIRPLLDFFRRDVEKWLGAQGISWREDESNLDLRYTRNRVRWMLLPEIRRVFGEGALERLRREADIFTACAKFIDSQAVSIYENAVIARFGDIIAFDSAKALESFWGFGEIVRSALLELNIGLTSLSFDTIERLWADIEMSRKGRWYPITEGAHLEYDDSIFFIFKDLKPITPIEVQIGEKVTIPGGQGLLSISKKTGLLRLPYSGGALTFRLPEHGDTTGGRSNLLRQLSRRGVPRLLRENVPVLFEAEMPLYSPLVGLLTRGTSLFELYVSYDGPLGKNLLTKT